MTKFYISEILKTNIKLSHHSKKKSTCINIFCDIFIVFRTVLAILSIYVYIDTYLLYIHIYSV